MTIRMLNENLKKGQSLVKILISLDRRTTTFPEGKCWYYYNVKSKRFITALQTCKNHGVIIRQLNKVMIFSARDQLWVASTCCEMLVRERNAL
jgi:hypothetical protein